MKAILRSRFALLVTLVVLVCGGALFATLLEKDTKIIYQADSPRLF